MAAEHNRLTALDVASNKDLCGVSLQGNAMEAEAINAMIAQLPDVTGQEPVPGSEWISILDISAMPGTASADAATAKAKGWRVINETSGIAVSYTHLTLPTNSLV